MNYTLPAPAAFGAGGDPRISAMKRTRFAQPEDMPPAPYYDVYASAGRSKRSTSQEQRMLLRNFESEGGAPKMSQRDTKVKKTFLDLGDMGAVMQHDSNTPKVGDLDDPNFMNRNFIQQMPGILTWNENEEVSTSVTKSRRKTV